MAVSDRTTKRNLAVKLHRQFAHPSCNKLLQLVRKAGIKDALLEKEIRIVSENCVFCIRHKRVPPRPIVCLPLASSFNEAVAMDLKAWEGHTFLVIVDVATRFCNATVVSNKLPSTIITGFFVCWIALFGAPQKVLIDNGGEFNNDDLRDLGDCFNIKILSTAAQAPFSNGICERLNGILGSMVSKISADAQCGIRTALAWAVSARNAFDNNFGYSPNQLVFGFNPVMPNVFQNRLPGLERVTSSETVRRHLNAVHIAREAFIRCESSDRISRALRSNVRESNCADLRIGDDVFYKRNNEVRWRGPGQVVGLAGKQVLVKHGGYLARVHTTRLVRGPRIQLDEQGEPDSGETAGRVNSLPDSGAVDANRLEDGVLGGGSKDADIGDSTSGSDGCAGLPTEDCADLGMQTDAKQSNSGSMLKRKGVAGAEPEDRSSKTAKLVAVWKKGDRFQGFHDDTGEYVSGRIVNRAGKPKGVNKDKYNIIRDCDGWHGCLDFNTLRDVTPIADEQERIVMFVDDAVTQAKLVELQRWKDNDVYEEVEDVGQKVISVRWVITDRFKNGYLATKARLVARGFEEVNVQMRRDSPTCSRESIFILITVASAYHWNCNTVDVKAAYLQGDEINRAVFLQPPPEFDNGRLWKLKKTVYGLCDAARAWYTRVTSELLSLSVDMCELDKSFFIWKRNGKLEGLICIYVDDFLWTGSVNFYNTVIKVLVTKFFIGSSESSSFTYIGLNITAYENGISVDQTQYATGIAPVLISQERSLQKDSPLVEAEKRAYRALVGQLCWLATHTRPDIAFDACELSVLFPNSKIADLIRLNKLVERVKRDRLSLFFS